MAITAPVHFKIDLEAIYRVAARLSSSLTAHDQSDRRGAAGSRRGYRYRRSSCARGGDHLHQAHAPPPASGAANAELTIFRGCVAPGRRVAEKFAHVTGTFQCPILSSRPPNPNIGHLHVHRRSRGGGSFARSRTADKRREQQHLKRW
jgi:hypothetical protein